MTLGRVHPLMLAGGDPCEGYQIGHSVRLNSADSAHLIRTPSGTNPKIWTWSGWVKRSAISGDQVLLESYIDANNRTLIRFNDSGELTLFNYRSGVIAFQKTTSAVFRDVAAPLHVTVTLDTDNAAAEDRARLYINGARVTAWAVNTAPTLGLNTGLINSTAVHLLGAGQPGQYLGGYLSDIHFIDGLALDASAFGFTCPTTGQWRPKKYTGAYGTNGFHLDFSDGSAATATALGADRSGNGNNWAPVNIDSTSSSHANNDWKSDTPSNNFPTLNPLSAFMLSGASISINQGNLLYVGNRSGTSATFGASSGRWYYEAHIFSVNSGEMRVGVQSADNAVSGQGVLYESGGTKIIDGVETAYGEAYTGNDVIGVAFDADAKTVEFFKNGASQGVIATPNYGHFIPGVQHGNGTLNSSLYVNFGQRPLAYTPPAGFKALCTKNLPTPLIVNPKKHFDVALWAGNGATQDIILPFANDLTWTKARNAAYSNAFIDRVRGAGNQIISDSTAAETFAANRLTAFNADGFSVGDAVGWNESGKSYVAWNWRKGALPGFDIVNHPHGGAGAEDVAHVLGVKPAMIIAKVREDGTSNWLVWHKGLLSESHYLVLQTTAAQGSVVNWQPTASKFSFLYTTPDRTLLAYLFAEVPGFSKFGSYVGNGSADGPFVHCGFRPAFVMVKRVDAAANWGLFDNARAPGNVNNKLLEPNTSAAEYTGASDYLLDFTANGFKPRGTGAGINASGGTYIYMAFAAAPFKFSNGV